MRQGRARADETHVAAEHVPQLGQLVQAAAPQERAAARHARVVGHLERPSADLVQTLHLLEELLSIRLHRAELQQLESSAVETGARLAKDHRGAIQRADAQRDDGKDGTQQDQRRPRQDKVGEALDEQANRPVRPVDERDDALAVEFLAVSAVDLRAGAVDRDADHLALAGAQPRDRLHEIPSLHGQADGYLVDHVGMEDVLDLFEWRDHRASQTDGNSVRTSQVAEHLQPEIGVAFDAIREPLRIPAGADDQEVASHLPPGTQRSEQPPEPDARKDGQDAQRDEQDADEKAAGVRDLDHEQQCDSGNCEGPSCLEERHGFAAQRPARPQPVKPTQPDHEHPATSECRGSQPAIGAEAPPDLLPLGSITGDRNGDEERHRANEIGRHERRAQR